MTWQNLPPEIRQTAETVLTPKQLAAYKLWEDGLGYSRIGLKLNISTSSARDRIHRALRTLEPHLEQAA